MHSMYTPIALEKIESVYVLPPHGHMSIHGQLHWQVF